MHLIRVVIMSFHPDKTEAFEKIFSEKYQLIHSFDGCVSVRLLHDVSQPGIYVTLSEWLSESHLEAYRKSTLFAETWTKTKALFNAPPQAFSLTASHFSDKQKNK